MSSREDGEFVAHGTTRQNIVLSPNNPFVLRDTGAGPNRIIVFGLPNLLRLIRSNPNLVADGTFKSAPTSFYQLFTIHFFISTYVNRKIFFT